MAALHSQVHNLRVAVVPEKTPQQSYSDGFSGLSGNSGKKQGI
jgi:hypothetical protein